MDAIKEFFADLWDAIRSIIGIPLQVIVLVAKAYWIGVNSLGKTMANIINTTVFMGIGQIIVMLLLGQHITLWSLFLGF